MKTALIVGTLCVAVPGVLSVARPPGWETGAQQPNPSPAQTPQKAPDPNACQQMMLRHQQVTGELKKLDTDLQQQIQAMQGAQGQAKVDAIARAVATLAEQRTQQRDRLMSLQMQTIAHLAEHSGQSGGLMQCPLMQELSRKQGGANR